VCVFSVVQNSGVCISEEYRFP